MLVFNLGLYVSPVGHTLCRESKQAFVYCTEIRKGNNTIYELKIYFF